MSDDDDWDEPDYDDELSDEEMFAEECGRWDNGRLTMNCSKAGSEECDFMCPYRDTLYGRRHRR